MSQPTLRESAGRGVQNLIDWAVQQELSDIPIEVRQQTVMVIADDLAAMLSAENEPQVAASQAMLLANGSVGQASVFRCDRAKLGPLQAALANALAASWNELDEGYRKAVCHAGLYTLPILLAIAESEKMAVSEVLRANTDQLVRILKRELDLREKNLLDELHYRTLERIFIEERIYKKIESCKTNEAVFAAVYEGFKPFKKELVRDIVDADVEKLLQVRIRRISLFDINKHREEMEKTKAELEETRKNLKGLTRYVINHLEALLEKYGPQYPRLTTKSARHEEVDVKAVAFKSFKVAYDRETGYVGYKVSGDEFKLECTKFDKVLLVFKDGTYKVTELPEKLFVGQELFYCGLPDREQVFTCAYTDREASYLKRFTFGGTIMNKAYSCIPEKSRILFFAPETPKTLYIRYKPAPHQKVSQQTCDPSQVDVKSPKTLGRQISIKDISSVTAEPTRGWDEKEATTKIVFA